MGVSGSSEASALGVSTPGPWGVLVLSVASAGDIMAASAGDIMAASA